MGCCRMGNTYFNPHSRKGSDDGSGHMVWVAWSISIHTPARGVTLTACNDVLIPVISIHTPARGVTIIAPSIVSPSEISIHTPARGVTEPLSGTCGRSCISIHTPARGVTYSRVCSWHLNRFQSTLPQGEWRQSTCRSIPSQWISIHTPARGVTMLPGPLIAPLADFNPHSRKGSDGDNCIKGQ